MLSSLSRKAVNAEGEALSRLPLVRGSRAWRKHVPSFIITETGSDAAALTKQVARMLPPPPAPSQQPCPLAP
ncbi:hypothetical protein ABBQ32_000457 [Trebouxia sp. C0010 RCD-2024]